MNARPAFSILFVFPILLGLVVFSPSLLFAQTQQCADQGCCDATLHIMDGNIELLVAQKTDDANEDFWDERDACFDEEDELRRLADLSYLASLAAAYSGTGGTLNPVLFWVLENELEQDYAEAEDVFFDCYTPEEAAFFAELALLDAYELRLQSAARSWHGSCLARL